MQSQDDSRQPDFWNERYLTGKTPWDFKGVPSNLLSFLSTSNCQGSVLIPGCGTGYEVKVFYETGWQVTAIDFSPPAVEQAKSFLGELGEKVILDDFFTFDFGANQFDIIYERTFLCSLPPTRWPDYARRMAELLLPEGRLVGIFLYGDEPEPPPYPLTEQKTYELFGPYFTITHSDSVSDSLPLFSGMEIWQEWKRKNATDKKLK